MEKKNEGYVYVLSNDCMPNLIKIGRTDRKDYRSRIRDLNNTSVPVPFKAVHVSKVADSRLVENALHTAFETERVNPKREFFRVEAHRVEALLRMIELEDVTEETNIELTEDLDQQEREALDRASAEREREEREMRTRRPTLNFADLDIRVNEHLYWREDRNVFVTVASDRRVIYDGKMCSLTRVTQELLRKPYAVQPTPYWIYEGESLQELYDRKYPVTDE